MPTVNYLQFIHCEYDAANRNDVYIKVKATGENPLLPQSITP